MAYIEGSYKQLLFGVSQQARKDRLEGQVEAQVNMTSDLTFGLRRRSPTQLSYVGAGNTARERGAFLYTELGGTEVVVNVDHVTGLLYLFGANGVPLFQDSNSYLQAPTSDDIQFAVVQDELYILNRNVKPAESIVPNRGGDPTRAGYFHVLAGAFAKDYTITIRVNDSAEHSVTHRTPTSSTNEPHLAQPNEVAKALLNGFAASPVIGTAAGWGWHRIGEFVFFRAPAGVSVSVTSGTGSNFVRTSNAQRTNLVTDLPPNLPNEADAFTMAVGNSVSRVYYRWSNADKAWVEDAAYEARLVLNAMPIVLHKTGPTTWNLSVPAWERRLAGDAESNPALNIVKSGITGIGAFQGRLVLLSGEYVCMSASGKPLRWYRSTVSQLLADDPIEIAASASLAAPYRHAVQFNQNLVVFSARHQSTVPGNVGITPQNATISISSTYTADANRRPIPVGMSLFFAAPRAAGYAAMWEMTPSPYSDNQLAAQDVTGHIPQYITGPIRWAAASSTTNILVVADSARLDELVIHEYLWQGTEKVHQSWHRWRFAFPVYFGYFLGDFLYLVTSVATRFAVIRVDIRQGAGEDTLDTGRLDYYFDTTVGSDGILRLPAAAMAVWARSNSIDAGIVQPVWGFLQDGPFKGVRERLTPYAYDTPSGQYLVRVSQPAGTRYRIGERYTSSVTPSAPVVRDSNGVPITTQRALLHKFVVSLQNTGEFTYATKDLYREHPPEVTSPLKFGSPELGVGKPPVADGIVHIPCRLDMQTTLLTLQTDDVYDLNITSLEYGFRYHQRYGRRA